MQNNDNVILSFDCPYCGYKYKLSGMKIMDRRVKCGNCDSRFSVRSEMATVTVRRNKPNRDTVFDF